MMQNAPLSAADALREGLDELAARPFSYRPPAGRFRQLRLWLEALQLDTADFSLAVNRLANAQCYLKSGEHGAARYELRLLRRSLEK